MRLQQDEMQSVYTAIEALISSMQGVQRVHICSHYSCRLLAHVLLQRSSSRSSALHNTSNTLLVIQMMHICALEKAAAYGYVLLLCNTKTAPYTVQQARY
jgi:hypothetical protein